MDQLAAALAAVVAVCTSASAPLKPLPSRSPEVIAPPSLRVHVRAHEDLDPDTLRSFARPRVTLWLETRSNVLKTSTLENLKRFDGVFVRLRAPVTETQSRALEAAPLAGLWVEASQLEGKGFARAMGPRPLAVQIKGPIDEQAFDRLQRSKPEVVEWQPGGEPDVMSFSLLKQLPGRKLVSVEPGGLPPRACAKTDEGPAARVHLATVLALSASPFPCGSSPIVVVALDTDRWLIQSTVVDDPTAELEVVVGNDELLARKARQLLDELGFGAHR